MLGGSTAQTLTKYDQVHQLDPALTLLIQFYQGGFRSLNGNGAIHAPMSGQALQPSVVTGAVYPNNLNSYTCGSGVGGARIADCLNILGS